MTQIISIDDSTPKGKMLLNLLWEFKKYKAVTFHKPSKDKPLTTADWVRPGRPATDEELEQLAIEMENDGAGEDIEIVFSRVKKNLKKQL